MFGQALTRGVLRIVVPPSAEPLVMFGLRTDHSVLVAGESSAAMGTAVASSPDVQCPNVFALDSGGTAAAFGNWHASRHSARRRVIACSADATCG